MNRAVPGPESTVSTEVTLAAIKNKRKQMRPPLSGETCFWHARGSSSAPTSTHRLKNDTGKPFPSIAQIPRATVSAAASDGCVSKAVFTKAFYIKALLKKHFSIAPLLLISKSRGADAMCACAFGLRYEHSASMVLSHENSSTECRPPLTFLWGFKSDRN